MGFGEKLRNLMRTGRFSQEDVAEAMDVHQTQVSKWATGKSFPRADDALRLARLLGTSLDFLLDDTLDAPPTPIGEGERILLTAFRRSGLDVAEAIERLAWRPTSDAGRPLFGASAGSESPRKSRQA